MYYCGLDIAMKSSYIYITDSQGRKKTSGEIPTKAGVFRQRLRPYLRHGLRVAIKAGNQTAWIYDLLVDLGAEVTVVNPAKVKLIAESRRKTDKVYRFDTSRKLVSYSGLCPTVRSSGERTEYGSISRKGRSELRAVWVQIAHLVVRDTSRSTARLRRWYSKVASHRGKPDGDSGLSSQAVDDCL